jgi:choline dehydrogenase-like flavoprotein
MTGRILAARDAPDRLSCQVCVVGSGAGGAVLAAGLAERGVDVLVLEEGAHRTRADYGAAREEVSYPMLYQERGGRATADLAITVLQGRAVGGTTVVNWTTCFRTPDRILQAWRDRFGVRGWGPEQLAPHFAAVEARLGIAPWFDDRVNANNGALRRGCQALGWEASVLRRNVRGCADSGFCGLGCPYDAKQAMHLTYLPDGLAAGLRVVADARAARVLFAGERAVGVEALVLSPETDRPTGRVLRVEAKVVVVAGGAINSPALLLRSGLTEPALGRRTFLHPVVGVMGEYDHLVNPWHGAPQSISSHQFVDRGPDRVGFFLEVAPLHPMLAALAFTGFGEVQASLMASLPQVASTLALAIDGLLEGDDGGTVRLKGDGRPELHYPIGPSLVEVFREAHLRMAELQFAAGAKRVGTLHAPPWLLTRTSDVASLAGAPYGALKHSIFSAHQMGGCAMGEDPSRSVVDSTLTHHRVRNLFVVDGSVLPTSLGVNPSQTIYGLAHRARDFVAAAV